MAVLRTGFEQLPSFGYSLASCTRRAEVSQGFGFFRVSGSRVYCLGVAGYGKDNGSYYNGFRV